MMREHTHIDWMKLKLMVIIIDRGKGDGVAKMMRQSGHFFNFISMGMGTAKSDILDYLGLNDSRKDVMFCFIRGMESDHIMKMLRMELEMDKPGHGIAFTIPISSVVGRRSYGLLSSRNDHQEGQP